VNKAQSPTESAYLTVQAALQQGVALLESAAIGVPRLTAEVLLCHAMQCDRAFLYAHSSDPLTQLAWIHYGRSLNERMKGKPTQYITHRQEFYGRSFYVDENVLIPRPETEHLVEKAIEYLRRHNPAHVLDVGTGSGAIAISIALEASCQVMASDISLPALVVARRNREALQAPVHFFQTDLMSSVAPSSIDLLVSNPPYVPGADAANMQTEVRDWEPHVALFASDDGFEIYRRLIGQAETVVRPNGQIMLEMGYRSLERLRQMLEPRWTAIDVAADLAGLPRVITATLR
jgi:release factor glutamine methyltransferase